MESSDDSFEWMTASSDSNDSNSEDNKMSAVKTKSEEGDSTDNKKTVHKRLFDGDRAASGGEEEPPRKRRKKLKRERAETPAPAAAGRVKREPASDSDSAELARRVKQELAAAAPAPAPARSDGGLATSDTDAFVSTDRKSVKKKSKKRKRKTSLNADIKDMMVEDSFSAEETVVESRSRSREVSNSLTRLNHQTEGDDTTSSQIKTCTSREFVSDDSSSSDENSKKKKKKHKRRHSEMQNEIRKSSESGERRTEATPVESLERAQTKQKISDRIRYEEEDDVQIENNHHLTNGRPERAAQSTRLKRFLKSNPQLKPVTPCFDGDSAVTPDDEVWVLRCPSEVDISNLKGKDLQLDSKCKLKINGQAFDGSLNEEKGTVAILSCQNNQTIINNISLNGTVNFRKRIPKPHFVEDNVIVNNQTNFIPLPDTKCRHPLFGSDYKKAMKIPSAIKARLKGEREPELEKPEKKKKKKKHREQAETAAAASHERPAAVAAPAGHGDAPPPKKAKKMKNEVSADTWESVKAIEESLFDF